jgi:hypothetical protein
MMLHLDVISLDQSCSTISCLYRSPLLQVSLLSFVACVSLRALLEFDLLHRKRIRSASLIISSVMSLFFHLLSFINRCLHSWPNLGYMTIYVLKMFVKRSITDKNPAELVSLLFLLAATGSLGALAWKLPRLRAKDVMKEEALEKLTDELDEVPLLDQQ